VIETGIHSRINEEMRPLVRSAAALAILLLVQPLPVAAQTKVVPESRAEVQLSFAPIVRESAPAVVNVYAARVDRRRQSREMEEFFRRFFGEGGPGVPPGRSQTSVGSGVIVDPIGLVITNNHVIENMTEVKIALADRREFDAEIVLRDPRTDLAVLRLKNASNLAVLPLGNSEALEVGDIVLAIGNPFGVGQTVTQGIISALARTQVGITDYQFFIQTDAAINPGNSGGPLVNMAGHVVGVNSMAARNGSIGFAIPSNLVKLLVPQLASKGKVEWGWLGVSIAEITDEDLSRLKLREARGVLIRGVMPGEPADQGGMRADDVLVAVDGTPLDTPRDLQRVVSSTPVGKRVRVRLLREGRETELEVTIGLYKEREPVKETPAR
jgi:Do/DeqQ family serine protease